MPNFTVNARAPARIPNDFTIDIDQTHISNDEEREFIAATYKALDQLADGAVADGRTRLRGSLATARADWRDAKTLQLKSVAADFANATISAQAAADRLAVIGAEISQAIPDVTMTSANPVRFADEFAIGMTAYGLVADEQAYVERQKRLFDHMAAHEAADIATKYSDAGLEARRKQRKDAIERLKQNFISWKEGASSEVAAANVSYVRGRYSAQRDQLKRKLFVVSPVRGTGENEGYNVDLEIKVADGLPAPDNEPTSEQQALYVDINKAATVISSVCREIRARANKQFWSKPGEEKRGLRLLGEYTDRLVGIGRLGLEGPHTGLAKLALVSLREEFIARQAEEILNRYVRRLGIWAAIFAVVFLVAYLYARNGACDGPGGCDGSWWHGHRSFLLAAIGASLGTWASFSVRKVNLTFEQLAAPEDQLLDAPLRILFVVLLTMAACLLFWTGAINVKIGDLNTEASWFSKVGTVAMLIGFFCGLSERALASALAGRASAFVGGVAGSR